MKSSRRVLALQGQAGPRTRHRPTEGCAVLGIYARAPEPPRQVGQASWRDSSGARRGERLTLGPPAPLSTPSAQAASVGANSPSLSSPPTAASGLNSAAAATGSGRASLQSTKVLRMEEGEESDMGSLGILEPAPPGTLGARLRAHEGGGSRDQGGIGWDGEGGPPGKLGGCRKGSGALEQGRAFSLTSPFSHLTLCPQSHLWGRCEKGQWPHPVAQLPRRLSA